MNTFLTWKPQCPETSIRAFQGRRGSAAPRGPQPHSDFRHHALRQQTLELLPEAHHEIRVHLQATHTPIQEANTFRQQSPPALVPLPCASKPSNSCRKLIMKSV